MAWIHSARYGLEITSDVGAKIGMTVGDDFEFLYDSELYENFTVTDDGITGDLVAFGKATQTLSCRYINDGSPKTIPFPSDWEVLNVSTPVRIGAYVKTDNGGLYNGRVYLDLRFYVEEWDRTRDTINISIGGSGSYGIKSRQLGSETLDITYMQSPGSYGSVPLTLDQYIGGNDNYYNRLNNGGYFDWSKKGANIPIFDTLEHCNAYLMDLTDQTLDGLLNASQESPEEEFINDQKYYKIKNLYARGSGSSWTPVKTINYRIKPVGGKICLYYHKPTANEPYEWVLYNYSGYDIYRSPSIVNDDDDDFTLTNNVDRHYLEHSVKFGDASYRVNIFDSDVPKWQSKEDADDYIRGDKDITEALNYDYIARTNQEILGPEIGLADAGNDNGHNGMVYSYGARMYVMSSSHLAGFFADVFNTANIDDILDGTKLFGANQINAISGIMYFPCAISEFCDITSEGATPHVGTWVCPTATSNGYVVKNNKLIDCGGDFLKPIYGDFRDLEPYQQLWVTLPFCGTHQLQLTKYLNRYMSFKYSIDAVTGACACHIYADGIEMDTFEGVCSSQRCISAIDQTTYLSNVIGSVNSALTSGVNAVGSGAQAIGGAVSGNVGSVVGGSLGLLGGGASGVLGAYNVMQAVDNPPMTTRGGSSGCLGFFGCTQIHLHFYQKKTVKPVHALMLCGAPSNVSGTVSSFAGYLKCSTFKMSDGFTGTNDELNEIMQLMRNGIYV